MSFNKTQVHHFEPESERQNMECKNSGSPAKKEIQNKTVSRLDYAFDFLERGRACLPQLCRGPENHEYSLGSKASANLQTSQTSKRRRLPFVLTHERGRTWETFYR
jgi:hypothetical protein